MKHLFLLIPLGLVATMGVQASPIYFFSLSGGGGFNASGYFLTSGTTSPYTITSITSGVLSNYLANKGSSSGSTISGGAINGVSTSNGATNTIPLASTGFSFADANGDNYNLHLLFNTTYLLSDSLGNLSEPTSSVTLTLVTLPEATTMALSALGLLGAVGLATAETRRTQALTPPSRGQHTGASGTQ